MSAAPDPDAAICRECGRHFDDDALDDDTANGGEWWMQGYSCAACIRASPYEARIQREP